MKSELITFSTLLHIICIYIKLYVKNVWILNDYII